MPCNKTFEELSKDDIVEIEKCMYANQLSTSGFLAKDEKLCDVYIKDKLYLESVGITYDQIADQFQYVIDEYHNGYSESYVRSRGIIERWRTDLGIPREFIDTYIGHQFENKSSNFLVMMNSYLGSQVCPFKSKDDSKYYGYEYGNKDYIIKNKTTGRVLEYSSLLPHMIRYHHFFEGSVHHRIDPSEIIDFFGITPETSFDDKYTIDNDGKRCLITEKISDDELVKLEQRAMECRVILNTLNMQKGMRGISYS